MVTVSEVAYVGTEPEPFRTPTISFDDEELEPRSEFSSPELQPTLEVTGSIKEIRLGGSTFSSPIPRTAIVMCVLIILGRTFTEST